MFFNILLVTLCCVFSGVLGAPTEAIPLRRGATTWSSAEDGLTLHNAGYQGDGFYVAQFNEDGVATVNFTANDVYKSALASRLQMAQDNNTIEDSLGSSVPITEINPIHATCGGGCFPPEEMGQVKRMIRYMMDMYTDGVMVNKGQWEWHFEGNHVVYMCSYAYQKVDGHNVRQVHEHIDQICKKHCNGFQRGHTGDKPELNAIDAAFGRARKGDHFCTKKFKGW